MATNACFYFRQTNSVSTLYAAASGHVERDGSATAITAQADGAAQADGVSGAAARIVEEYTSVCLRATVALRDCSAVSSAA
jgi:hypothetical protein